MAARNRSSSFLASTGGASEARAVAATIASKLAAACSASPYFAAITRSEEHTSELQSLMRISYAVLCLKKKLEIYKTTNNPIHSQHHHTIPHDIYTHK